MSLEMQLLCSLSCYPYLAWIARNCCSITANQYASQWLCGKILICHTSPPIYLFPFQDLPFSSYKLAATYLSLSLLFIPLDHILHIWCKWCGRWLPSQSEYTLLAQMPTYIACVFGHSISWIAFSLQLQLLSVYSLWWCKWCMCHNLRLMDSMHHPMIWIGN